MALLRRLKAFWAKKISKKFRLLRGGTPLAGGGYPPSVVNCTPSFREFWQKDFTTTIIYIPYEKCNFPLYSAYFCTLYCILWLKFSYLTGSRLGFYKLYGSILLWTPKFLNKSCLLERNICFCGSRIHNFLLFDHIIRYL